MQGRNLSRSRSQQDQDAFRSRLLGFCLSLACSLVLLRILNPRLMPHATHPLYEFRTV